MPKYGDLKALAEPMASNYPLSSDKCLILVIITYRVTDLTVALLLLALCVL